MYKEVLWHDYKKNKVCRIKTDNQQEFDHLVNYLKGHGWKFGEDSIGRKSN